MAGVYFMQDLRMMYVLLSEFQGRKRKAGTHVAMGDVRHLHMLRV